MLQNNSISFLGEDSNKSSAKCTAAPLEQNVKNLECDGTVYKVIKEDPKMQRKQQYAISPSRKAIVREMQREEECGHKEKHKAKNTDAFAIIAGSGAANEEIMANERDIRQQQILELFMTHTRHKVRMQAQLKQALSRNNEVKIQEKIKEVIQSTVLNYYIPPKKPSRGDDDDSSRSPNKAADGMAAIRNIVSSGGPMSEGKKSVVFSQNAKGSTGTDKNKGKVDDSLKLLELQAMYERPDIGNQTMNGILDKVYQGRKKIRDRIQVDSPIDHRSRASKRSAQRRNTKIGATASGGFASINDSIVQSDKNQTMEVSNANLGLGNLTMNKTLIGKLSQKMEKRDFNQEYSQVDKTLTALGAERYDTCEDIAMLQLRVTKTFEKTRMQWKAWDEVKLLRMITSQVVIELCRLEERKQVRRAQAIITDKQKEKARRDRDEADTAMAVQGQQGGGRYGSPSKGGGMDQSQFSGSNKSPTKTMLGGASPSRGGQTQTDKESVMTGMTKMSPTKNTQGFQGANSMAAIMARAGVAAKKGGLTLGSKDMQKLNKGKGASQSGKSLRSAGTRKTGASRSKKSEVEDFDAMDIDEINGLAKQCEDEIAEAERGKRQVTKKAKNSTQLNLKKDLAPFNEAIKFYTKRQIMFMEIIDLKTPFYEKMPKDNQFYKHYMNSLQLVNMQKMLADTVEQEKNIFQNALFELKENDMIANQAESPGKVRRVFYN